LSGDISIGLSTCSVAASNVAESTKLLSLTV